MGIQEYSYHVKKYIKNLKSTSEQTKRAVIRKGNKKGFVFLFVFKISMCLFAGGNDERESWEW